MTTTSDARKRIAEKRANDTDGIQDAQTPTGTPLIAPRADSGRLSTVSGPAHTLLIRRAAGIEPNEYDAWLDAQVESDIERGTE